MRCLLSICMAFAASTSALAIKRAQPYGPGEHGCYYPAEVLGSSGCIMQGVTEHGCPLFNNDFCDSKVTWIPDTPPSTLNGTTLLKLERRQYDPSGCVYNGPILGSMGCIRNGWDEHGCPQFNGQPECQRRVMWYPPNDGPSPRPPPPPAAGAATYPPPSAAATYPAYSAGPAPAYASAPPAGPAVVTITSHSLIYDVQPTTKVFTSNVVQSTTTTYIAVSHSTDVRTISSTVFDIKQTTNELTLYHTATSTLTVPEIKTLNVFSTKVQTLSTYITKPQTAIVTQTTRVGIPVQVTSIVTQTTRVGIPVQVTSTNTVMVTQTTLKTLSTTITYSGPVPTITKTMPAVTTTMTMNHAKHVPTTIIQTITVTAGCPPKAPQAVSTRLAERQEAQEEIESDGGAGFCNVSFKKGDGRVYWEGTSCRPSETCREVGWLEGRPIYFGTSCF